MIRIEIDGKSLCVEEGTTLLRAATDNGIKIPNLCYDGRVELYGACGLCVVEVEGIPKLLRACSAKATDGMVVHTQTPRTVSARKTALELLLSDHDGDCRAPCTLACPANTDCQGYVGLIANGEYEEAARVIKEKVPIPASIGRVCPHPCEKKCRRQYVDEPISLAALKSFAADMDMASENAFIPTPAPSTGKKVAIAGGGPAGLTAAYFLRLAGHEVTIYDAMPKMGGMLRYGIPEYRLPKRVLDAEIRQIEALGITFKNNTKIGTDVTLADLQDANDAVLIAAGAWNSSKMRVEGEDLAGVLGGIDFLRAVALGERPNIGKKVAVVGGGNTAMDACRTAVRLGAEEVYIIYRRTENEMPADKEEIRESKEEGVVYKFLTNPIAFTGENGKLTGARLQKMQLGEPDAGGRRRPEPIEGAIEEIELDTAIMAIGQYPNLAGFEAVESTKRGTVAADEQSFRTSLPGVFAVGDITNKGADIAIAAVGEAQKASVVIDRYLSGEEVGYKKPFVVEREIPTEFFDRFEKAPRAKMPQTDPEVRKHNFEEVSLGLSEEAARQEAMRCLECGCHDFFECKLVSYANDYAVQPQRFAGQKHSRNNEDTDALISRNTDKCILCGLCVRVCDEAMGKTTLGLIGRGFDTIVQPEFDLPLNNTKCAFCGQCVTVCPTGALREKLPVQKRVPARENSQKSVCNLCSGLCSTDIRYVGNTVFRVLPYGEQGLLCKGGRFGVFALNSESKLSAPLSMEQLTRVREKLSGFATEEIAVVVGSAATLEESFLAKELGGENTFTLADENAAGFAGMEWLGIKKADESALRGFKAIVAVGAKLPDAFYHNGVYVVSLDCFKTEADEQIAVAPFVSNSGTYLRADGTLVKLQKAVDCTSPKARDVLSVLADIPENSFSVLVSEYKDCCCKKTVQKGGLYAEIKDSTLIEEFLKTI